MSTSKRKRSTSITLFAVLTFLSVCLMLTWTGDKGGAAAAQTDQEPERPQQVISPPTFTEKDRTACIDPYRRPGYLYTGRGEDYRNTRWIPYTQEFWGMPEPPSAKYPPDSVKPDDNLWFDEASHPEPHFLNGPLAPKQWMTAVVEEDYKRYVALQNRQLANAASTFVDQRDGGGLGWLWGRVVLLVSDSIDRYMMEFFCKELVGALYESRQSHTIASCFVPAFNLTFVHWHGVGMPTYKMEPFWDSATSDVPWEMRYQNIWSPTGPYLVGANGHGPDLILWQSALWDREDFAQFGAVRYGENSTMSSNKRQAVWDELVFYAARARKMLSFLRARFGSQTPLMLRAATLHRFDPQYDLMLYDLDRLSRGLAEQFDMEIFEWGRMLSGQHSFYHDKLHFTQGPASWLWATMVLEYLARSAGVGSPANGDSGSMVPAERATYFSGWQACNPYLTDWGGR